MASGQRVPDAVVRRLPIYYRYLCELENQGVMRISSQELGRRIGYTASQIRQDINSFGGFGHQGYGYEVRNLKVHIAGLLGIDKEYPMVIVGVGNLGRALAGNPIYPGEGYRIIGLFDVDPEIVGNKINGLTVNHYKELPAFLTGNPVRIGIIAAPSNEAQGIAEKLVNGGVEAIWNYASTDVFVEAIVHNMHLSDALLVLSYRLNERNKKD